MSTKYDPLDKGWSGRLKRVYGISSEQYILLLNEQGGACGVCLRQASSFTKRLAVDHDHKTGEVRGLLCSFCNQRVVGRHRDPSLFERAATYLRKGTGWFVPKPTKKRRSRRSKKVT